MFDHYEQYAITGHSFRVATVRPGFVSRFGRGGFKL